MSRRRRGMIIKNVSEKSVSIEMDTRTLHLSPGDEKYLTAEEVLDSALRENLQVRTVAVVRPASEEEESSNQTNPDNLR